MKKKQIEFFRAVLNRQIDDLMHHSDLEPAETLSQSHQQSESIDRASADTDQSLKLKIRSRESLLIRKLVQALERVETDSYGICDTCGEDIALQRLEARPVTTKCIHCKEEEEKRELLMK